MYNWRGFGGFLLAIVVMIRMMLMTIYVLVRALKPFLSLVYSSGHCCDITDDVDDNAGDNVCFGRSPMMRAIAQTERPAGARAHKHLIVHSTARALNCAILCTSCIEKQKKNLDKNYKNTNKQTQASWRSCS